jgi:cytochrome oxidase Cu insertion factor (SCO1/SenC/PrrC family)
VVAVKLLLSVIFVALVCATSFGAAVEDASPQRGKSVARISWTDDTGRLRQLSEFAGFPLILLPIYTRCPGACVANVEQLKNALSDSSADIRQFRVLLFSFDAGDTRAKLAAYRAHEGIPLPWFVGTSSQPSIDALLESIGFQYGRAGKEFAHPNLLLVLDSKLRIAKWIYGTGYTGRDLDLALKVASGESDWVGQHSEWLYAALLFGGSLLCVAFVYYLTQLTVLKRTMHRAQVTCGDDCH